MNPVAATGVRPYGPTAWLVEHADPIGWSRGLRAEELDGVIDIVPAESTVLVTCRRDRCAEIGDALSAVEPIAGDAEHEHVTIPVVYDGDDLASVATAAGITPAEVVALHTAATYRVAFCGFSPGFAYIAGLDERLHLPRRAVPRTSVPAGSVAIAAHYVAVYPSASPGGWHLLGRTALRVWDVHSPQPALLVPGTVVTFEAAG